MPLYNPTSGLGATVESSEIAFPIDKTSAATTTDVLTIDVTGDTNDRFVLNADGEHEFGPGNAALDTEVRRDGAGTVRVGRASDAAANGVQIGYSAGIGTAIVYFTSADEYVSATSGQIAVKSALAISGLTGGGFLQGIEQSADPAAPAANAGRLFFKDNGSGKTQLAVRFNTGATQIVATEP